jgi:inner membrane protein
VASAPTHAFTALGIGAVLGTRRVPPTILVTGMFCSVLPDADVLGFRMGIHYEDLLGHRGLSHSILFAAVLSGLVTLALRVAPHHRRWAWLYLFLATASHGLLDAMTNGGLGVAFFAPFVNDRYFLPFRPIVVSPIAVGRFFSSRGMRVLVSEATWIWLPVAAAMIVSYALRARRSRLYTR